MKPTSFVSTVGEISAEEAVGVPDLDAVISYWTDNGYTAEEWFHELNDHWGPAGFALRRGGEVQGFAVYAPPEHLARAARFRSTMRRCCWPTRGETRERAVASW